VVVVRGKAAHHDHTNQYTNPAPKAHTMLQKQQKRS